jgi:hypothetical protein
LFVIRLLVWLAILAVLVYVAVTVPLGKKTFVQHVRSIWHTEQVQDLKEGVKETAGPAVHRVERGVKAGYEAMTGSDPNAVGSGSGYGSGSAHLPTPQQVTHTAP